MKKIYKYTLLLIAAFLFAPLAANADEVKGIKLEKDVSGPDENDQYTITLGTFVNGSSVTTVTESTRPTDIVLVLDVSGSMNTVVYSYTKGNRVTGNLNNANVYIYVRNGVEYYLARIAYGNAYRPSYSWRYKEGSVPSSISDGIELHNGQNLNASNYEIYSTTANNLGTRMELMKTAVKSFIQTVYQKNPTSGDKHQIAIVKFAGGSGNDFESVEDIYDDDWWNPEFQYNGTRVIADLQEVESATQFDGIINALQYGGGTNSAKGMETAVEVFNGEDEDGNLIKENGHAKVTVLFTDGEPGLYNFYGNGSQEYQQLAQSTARRAVNAAYALKNFPATVPDDNGGTKTIESKVYSVALLSSGGYGDQAGRYLHYTSSNYKFQFPEDSNYDFTTNYSTYGGSEKPQGYYFLTGGDNLTDIFESIASESAEVGGTSTSVTETSLVTVDVVSNYFKLPDGVSADNVGAIQVLFAPMTGIKDQSQWNNATYMENLDNYLFGEPVTAAVAEGNDPNPLILVSGEHQYPQVVVGKDADTGGDKITVTNYNFADNYCGPNKDQNGNFRHWRGYKLVIKIPIVVDVQNPGGASLETNAEGSGIYIAGSTEPLVPFPRPKVTLPNIIIRKFGLLYEGESASFRLEKLTDTGEVDTHVKPYNIVITATDSNPDTYDFVQVKLQHHGRYRVTETDWGWSYDCTVGSKVEYPYISGDNLTEEQEAANAANLAKMEEKTGDEDADKMKEINVSGELSQTTFSPSNASQPYINRDVSGDTEQTVNLPGGSVLSGAVFDFHNTIKTETVDGQTKPLEKRNYSEAYKLNIFKFKGTVTTEESDETGN